MLNGLKPLSRSLRWGMVGGGGTSQIGLQPPLCGAA